MEAAKREVAVAAVRRLSDRSYRRFIVSSPGVLRILGTNVRGELRVRFLDAAYGLIPPRRELPKIN